MEVVQLYVLIYEYSSPVVSDQDLNFVFFAALSFLKRGTVISRPLISLLDPKSTMIHSEPERLVEYQWVFESESNRLNPPYSDEKEEDTE